MRNNIMFYYQTSAIGPNPLAATTEEEEETRYKKRTRLFREVGNQPAQRSKTDLFTKRLGGQGMKENQQEEEKNEFQLELQKLYAGKRNNVIMKFSSDEEDGAEIVEGEGKVQTRQEKEQTIQPPATNRTQGKEDTPLVQIPKKNNFLLDFSDDEDSQEQEETQAQKEEVSALENTTANQQPLSFRLPTKNTANNNNLILDFDTDSGQEEEGVDQQQDPISRQSIESFSPCGSHPHSQPSKDLLSTLLSLGKQKYYLEPIPAPHPLQCVIKRQRSTSNTKYHVYHSATLRHMMTVIKAEDGYLFVSKYEQLTNSTPSNKGQIVVAKLISNFFGTEFNCYLWNYPYKKFAEFTIDPDKTEQVITIEYETNIFGLKGPRKMTAFLPGSQPLISKKRLNQLYEHEKKKQLPPSVRKFRNKTPKWNPSIEAYVLNFYGRATVSSIKNFIMVGERDNENAEPKVLFGKFGKDLFNMDIRPPFNLLQGVALALSSFDKKLACE